ncbi:cytochrome c oxidase subunit II [Candidatus Binatus sp.]|uniref:cytochrome c oxidase subunit II n=1 Tax=Candidatus Binatus sp. TaxID=2811406 RepID=UPI00272BD807|nr:cytochrome c oxidase subunit II [Candidatus Binatus sp.]
MTTLAPKSDLAEWIYRLFIRVTLWDAAILAIVVVAFILAVFVFSSRVGEAAPSSTASSDLSLEVAWTLGPALILLMISIPTVRTIFRSQTARAPADALAIKVIGHQWWWDFQYPDGIKTANELHIPSGRAVRLKLESDDIIHSFWVPQLGGKRDLVPGQVNEIALVATTPGMYPGQCAEFCGLSHANMRFRVFVDSPADFAKWQAAEIAGPAAAPPDDHLAADGAKVFANSPCTTCHTIQGVSKGYLGPELTHFGSRSTLAAGVLANTPDNVAKWITDPQSIKPGANMPPLILAGPKRDALVAYLESLK